MLHQPLRPGQVNWLIDHSHIRPSHKALELSIRLACSSHARPHSLLYFCPAGSITHLRDALLQIFSKAPFDPPPDLVFNFSPINLTNPKSTTRFMKILLDSHCSLAVIDNTRFIQPRLDHKLLDCLNQVSQYTQATLILVTPTPTEMLLTAQPPEADETIRANP